MEAFKRLFSQNGHRCFSNPPPPRHLVSLFRRHFSNEPQPSPTPEPSSEPNETLRKPIPIQPVSYPTKPRPPPFEETQQEYPPEKQTSSLDTRDYANPETRFWTRDEMRYIKDAPVISPVSYASRVAPLPEDRIKVGEEKGDRNEELEWERRRIEEDRWRGVLRYGKEEEEEENLPFPKLIKVENTDQESKNIGKVIYDLKEAIRLVKANAKKTFDETLEAHVRMTPDLRRTDLKLSGFVRLPHGFGKTYRVAVFAEGAAADEAQDARADIVGSPELVENIQTVIEKSETINARHQGTLTNDISRTVKEAKEQSALFKKDKTAIVHVALGKVNFPEDCLRENIGSFVHTLLLAKPAGLKKSSKYAGYVDSFHICSTMGPSFPISIQSLCMAADRFNRLQL